MMLTYEEAKAALFDWNGEPARILQVWETETEFIFQFCGMQDDPDWFRDWEAIDKKTGYPEIFDLEPGFRPEQIERGVARRIV